jgi:hypothetical protein
MNAPNTCCTHAAPRLFFSFNVEYHIPPTAAPFSLFDDASMLLNSAFHLLDRVITDLDGGRNDLAEDRANTLAVLLAASQMVQMGKNAMGAAHSTLLGERRHG